MPMQWWQRCQHDAGNNASTMRGDIRAQQGWCWTWPLLRSRIPPCCTGIVASIMLASLPSLCWHCWTGIFAIVCWGCCPSHAGICPIATTLATSSSYMAQSLCSLLLYPASTLLSISQLLCISHLPLSLVPCWLLATSTTFATIASIVIIAPLVVAVVDVLKEQHILAPSSLPSLESDELDVLSSLSAASLQQCFIISMVRLQASHSWGLSDHIFLLKLDFGCCWLLARGRGGSGKLSIKYPPRKVDVRKNKFSGLARKNVKPKMSLCTKIHRKAIKL